MSKRLRPSAKDSKRAKKRRRTSGPARSYSGSRVPLASRGYRPNPVEKKVFDVAPVQYQVNTTGTFTLLSIPQVGADMNNRIGRKIWQKSVYIRGYINTEASQNTTLTPPLNIGAQQARMILFCDMQPNGATPTVTDLLNSASPAAHLNLNNRDRFKIYTDKTWVFDPIYVDDTNGGASTTNQIRQVKKFKKISLETIFSTSTGAIADITSGALYMFWIGSHVAGAGTDIVANIGTRVRYLDL